MPFSSSSAQNALAASAFPQTWLGELTAFPRPLAGLMELLCDPWGGVEPPFGIVWLQECLVFQIISLAD